MSRELTNFFARVGARTLVSRKTGAPVDMWREGNVLVFECKADNWRFDFVSAPQTDTSTRRKPKKDEDDAEGD
jgi:hypothetical protein